jgi:stage II sporulation protein AB (anti-sigma F factor)
MKKINELKMVFDSRSVNESFSRMAVAAFSAQLDMTVEELGDIKTVVSEAVTNCIVHAYREQIGKIYISCTVYEEGVIRVSVRDRGCGIEDISKAMEPLYTSVGGERSGLGFSVMESFSDRLRVRSVVGKGTTVTFDKNIKGKAR